MLNDRMLEVLLIDRALGALSPDVAVLLTAYLANNPDAARVAAEFDATVRATTATLQRSIPERDARSLPPFPADRIRSERARRVWSIWVTRVAAMAACLAIGAWLGGAMTHRVNPLPQAPVLAADAGRHWFRPAGASVAAVDFWSVERIKSIQANQTRNQPNKVRALIWPLAGQRVRNGGKLW